jgi:hypothetical protein
VRVVVLLENLDAVITDSGVVLAMMKSMKARGKVVYSPIHCNTSRPRFTVSGSGFTASGSGSNFENCCGGESRMAGIAAERYSAL